MREELIRFLKEEVRPGLVKTGPISATLSRRFEGDVAILTNLITDLPDLEKYLLAFYLSDSNPLFQWEATSFLKIEDFHVNLTVSQANSLSCVRLLIEGDQFPPENLATCLVELLGYKTIGYSPLLTSLEPWKRGEWTISGFNEDILTIIRNLKVLHVDKAYRDWKVTLDVQGKDQARDFLTKMLEVFRKLKINLATMTVGQSDRYRRITAIFFRDDLLIALDVYVRI